MYGKTLKQDILSDHEKKRSKTIYLHRVCEVKKIMEKQGKMHEDTPWRIQDHNKEWSFYDQLGASVSKDSLLHGGAPAFRPKGLPWVHLSVNHKQP